MRFERGGDEHDLPVERVRRHAPLDRFLDVGEDGVDTFADMFEDRARERLSLGDVGVDARVAAHKIPPPRISRRTPIKDHEQVEVPSGVAARDHADAGADHRQRNDQPVRPAKQRNEGDHSEEQGDGADDSETRLNIGCALASFRRLAAGAARGAAR